jgi:methionine-R-sulfoxide reductase
MINRRTFLRDLGLSAVFLSGLSAADRLFSAGTGAPPQTVKVCVFGKDGKLTGPIDEPLVVKTDDEWKKLLTPAEYDIVRGKGTEPAFCGGFLDNHKDGYYLCICCALPLFESTTKFNSGTGWPSFYQPIAPQNITNREDHSWGMDRTEILCTRCVAHLGHVFDDGPAPTGLRYCLNSGAMSFVAKGQQKPDGYLTSTA